MRVSFILRKVLGLQAQKAASQVILRELLRGDEGGARIYRVLQQKAGSLNFKRLLLKKTRYLKWRNLVLFYIWEDARVWAHWNHSFDVHLSYLGPVSCVCTSWVSSELIVGSGCSLMAARWQAFFPSRIPSRLTSSPLAVAAITDDCDILCLPIGPAIFHFSVYVD